MSWEQRNADFCKAQTDAEIAYIEAERRVKALEDENAKLRELVRIAIEYCVNGYCAEEDECPLYESRHSCRLQAEARELGVDR